MRSIKTYIIFSYEELHKLFIEKAQKGASFLLFDEPYFNEIIEPGTVIRDTYSAISESLSSMEIIKYVNFKLKGRYGMAQIKELIKLLKTISNILVTFYNPRTKECTIFFICSKKDYLLKRQVEDFIEMEVL
ncbi:MAG: hypothetical protein J6I85_00140 [Clostridia bacterium]|nr:hypothetical protein [Clostridia bacterium]